MWWPSRPAMPVTTTFADEAMMVALPPRSAPSPAFVRVPGLHPHPKPDPATIRADTHLQGALTHGFLREWVLEPMDSTDAPSGPLQRYL